MDNKVVFFLVYMQKRETKFSGKIKEISHDNDVCLFLHPRCYKAMSESDLYKGLQE
jgi:hypothetical protein